VISEAASPANDAVAATLTTSSHPLAVVAGPAAGTVWVEEAGGVLQEITEAASPASDTLGSPVSLPGGYPYLNDPQTVAADPHTGTVWATDGDGVSVINAANSSVTTTIPLSGSPEAVAVDPATGTVFVAGNSSGTVYVISEATDTVTATIQIPPQGGSPADPMAMAVDEAARTVYVSSFVGSLTVISETTDSITATIDVGGAA
jgi:YVTN family beta-propeller protein